MLAFSIDYYGMIFRATQSVELFCAYFFSEYLPEAALICFNLPTISARIAETVDN